MLQIPGGPRATGGDLASRLNIALDRIEHLIARYDLQATRALRSYHIAQALTVGLAAITPCLIFLAKDNPKNEVLNWLQLFFPAIAAIAAGTTHIFRWREDAVRYTSLAEVIRSVLWRFQTRAGEFNSSSGAGVSDEQALDQLVVKVDEVNLQSVARWSAAQVAEAPAATVPTHAAIAGADR
jgi:Protein of unknown function (DUF4231)